MAAIHKFGPFRLDSSAGILFCGAEPTMLGQLHRPDTGIGPGWRSFFCVNAPLLFHRLPQNPVQLPGADPGGTPVPRASGRRSEGHRSGSWTRTSVRLLQGQAGMLEVCRRARKTAQA